MANSTGLKYQSGMLNFLFYANLRPIALVFFNANIISIRDYLLENFLIPYLQQVLSNYSLL